MIHIAHDHFLDQFAANVRVVTIVPARQFIEHVQPQLIAQIQKLRVGRVMRHAHGVHVHVFHRLDVQAMNRFAQTTA